MLSSLLVTNRRMGLVAAAFLAAGWVCSCGYSEDEWQAQLAKQRGLEAKNSELEADLAKVRSRAQKLAAELEKMGVQLNEEGTAKQAMAKDIEQMKQALDEYRQRAQVLERIKQRFEVLRQKLEKLTNLGLDVRIRNNRMVISLPGDVLFASGQDTLREDGQTILTQVADVIRGDDSLRNRLYQVAGHTDNMPLKRTASMFHDNWGLSLMRARQVLVYLVTPTDANGGGGGFNPKLWSASGYGETDPVASNDTPDGRSKNRRVELILLPDVEEMLDLKSLL
jgi:chemotaxis protein MotB